MTNETKTPLSDQERADRREAKRKADKRRTALGAVATSLALGVSAMAYAPANRMLDRAAGLDAAAAVDEISGDSPYKEYIVQAHDRVWNIANRAFPEDANDPARSYDHRQLINIQEVAKDGIIEPGDVIKLPADAKIGTLVNPETRQG